MAKLNKRFKKNPKYPHQRSEGLTRRGAARQVRLMRGPTRCICAISGESHACPACSPRSPA